MNALVGLLIIVVVFILIILFASIKVVQEYERGVVFRLGRLMGARGPGLILLIPFLERMQKVDLRTVTMDIPAQEVITQDNVTIRVNAVCYFRVIDANASVVNIADFIRATSQIAQTTLRSVLGQSALDDLLAEREKINQQLATIIDSQTEPWGVKVSIVEVKDVELPQSMQRAMARQAEAEREKRAKIIHAQGEFQSSQQLAAAAQVMSQNPATIQLRYLQTLNEIGAENSTTIIFPVPIDILSTFMGMHGTASETFPGSGSGSGSGAESTPPPDLADLELPDLEAPVDLDVEGSDPSNGPVPRPDLKGMPAPSTRPIDRA